jgi:hypothetical protein
MNEDFENALNYMQIIKIMKSVHGKLNNSCYNSIYPLHHVDGIYTWYIIVYVSLSSSWNNIKINLSQFFLCSCQVRLFYLHLFCDYQDLWKLRDTNSYLHFYIVFFSSLKHSFEFYFIWVLMFYSKPYNRLSSFFGYNFWSYKSI